MQKSHNIWWLAEDGLVGTSIRGRSCALQQTRVFFSGPTARPSIPTASIAYKREHAKRTNLARLRVLELTVLRGKLRDYLSARKKK
jgi:hypothetical protein